MIEEHGKDCACDGCEIGRKVFSKTPVGHPGINCACKECEEAKRRFRYKRRKMQAEDRERDRILGTERAKLDNKFLADCGIAPVTFDRGKIVPWKGLLCDDNERHRGQGQVLLKA